MTRLYATACSKDRVAIARGIVEQGDDPAAVWECPKCISLDDNNDMLSDKVDCCAGEENIRDLRRAAFNRSQEFGSLLREFIDSHKPEQAAA